MSFHLPARRNAAGVFAVASMFALSGCNAGTGTVSPSIPSQVGQAGAMRSVGSVMSIMRHEPPASYQTLYRFKGGSDGQAPAAGLIDVGSTLYGTTIYGGSSGNGTFFKITTAGKENVLHNFGSQPNDGTKPNAGLISVGGTLYGTTSSGGTTGSGAVYEVTAAGKESVVYSFGTHANDGLYPTAALLNRGGTLYGTTQDGGGNPCSCGTVFKVTATGAETVVRNFAGDTGLPGAFNDGRNPWPGLLDVAGSLYGTTFQGGTKDYGTVFKIAPSGQETILYNFTDGADGGLPTFGGLIDVGGVLYGTTAGGGTKGAGTVFKITTSGNESVLYSFGSQPNDGSGPDATLTVVDGVLYGTTVDGGGSACSIRGGCGTIFKVTLSGSETVLHAFASGSDGAFPQSPLTNVAGTLYGTTGFGGGTGCGSGLGCGTVFSIKP